MAPSRRRRIVSALAGVVVVPAAVVACNDIIGLSDYKRVECTGLVCADSGALFDGPLVDSGDGGTDPTVDASGTHPVRWAAWPMPNYVIPGADATTNPNPMSYSKFDGGVLDNVTKLVWAQPMPAEAANRSFADATAFCEKLPNGPWRLPSRIELVTLLDLSKDGAAKIDATFAGTPASAHWTSSEVRPFGRDRKYWVVDFGEGGLAQLEETSRAAVRCVKDGPR
jgi:hypothetical protein